MAVRTLQLGAIKATSTLAVVYTCPAGRTAIVKELSVGKGGTGALVCSFSVLRGAVAWFVAGISLTNLGTQSSHQDRWLVLEPGDVLRAVTDGLTADVWVSGTELLGVA